MVMEGVGRRGKPESMPAKKQKKEVKASKDDATVVPVDDRGKATMNGRRSATVSATPAASPHATRGTKRKKKEEGEEGAGETAAALATEGKGNNSTRPASARQLVRKRGRDADVLLAEGIPFSVALSKKEILEDLTRMAGHVPVKWRKVKRRNVWGPSNMLNLGKFLHLVSLEHYDPEKFL